MQPSLNPLRMKSTARNLVSAFRTAVACNHLPLQRTTFQRSSLLHQNQHSIPSRTSSRTSHRMAFRGPVQQHIEETVASAFEPAHLEVTNESHGRIEDESHFHVLVVSDAFDKTPLIQRHRAVQALFTDEHGALKFHSLRITAKTTKQWGKNATVSAAPKCTGKGDGRAPTDASQFE